MKKVVIFGLCFLIILSSFVFCFADDFASAVLLPNDPDPLNSSYYVSNSSDLSGIVFRYSANADDVYIARLSSSPGSYSLLVFSLSPGRVVYSRNRSSVISSIPLSFTDGNYYFADVVDNYPYSNIPVSNYSSPSAFFEDFYNSNNIIYVLNQVVSSSVSWFSSMAYAVKNNGLLLFFVLFIFVGVAIGLLNRFRKE